MAEVLLRLPAFCSLLLVLRIHIYVGVVIHWFVILFLGFALPPFLVCFLTAYSFEDERFPTNDERKAWLAVKPTFVFEKVPYYIHLHPL